MLGFKLTYISKSGRKNKYKNYGRLLVTMNGSLFISVIVVLLGLKCKSVLCTQAQSLMASSLQISDLFLQSGDLLIWSSICGGYFPFRKNRYTCTTDNANTVKQNPCHFKKSWGIDSASWVLVFHKMPACQLVWTAVSHSPPEICNMDFDFWCREIPQSIKFGYPWYASRSLCHNDCCRCPDTK